MYRILQDVQSVTGCTEFYWMYKVLQDVKDFTGFTGFYRWYRMTNAIVSLSIKAKFFAKALCFDREYFARNYTAGVQSESPLISDLGEVAHW